MGFCVGIRDLVAAITFLYLPTVVIVAGIVGPIEMLVYKASYGIPLLWVSIVGVGLLVGWAARGTLYIFWKNWRALPAPEQVTPRPQSTTTSESKT